jgi:large-conductance mechanosensitive channel
MAGETATTETHRSLGEAIANFLPFLIIMILVVFLILRITKRNKPYLDRSISHMEHLEKQNDEIITLLKEIAQKR